MNHLHSTCFSTINYLRVGNGMIIELAKFLIVWLVKSVRAQLYIHLGWKLTKTAFSQPLVPFIHNSKKKFLEKGKPGRWVPLAYQNSSSFDSRLYRFVFTTYRSQVLNYVVFLFQRVPAKCFTSVLIACQEVTCMMTLAIGTTAN